MKNAGNNPAPRSGTLLLTEPDQAVTHLLDGFISMRKKSGVGY
jgi:hypothetical protein